MTKNQKTIINNWLVSAKEDRQTALILFKHGRYGWSLFIFHLAIEKLLKAQLVKVDHEVIYTHDLEKLAALAKLNYTFKQKDELKEISTFNLKARYDMEKLKFYQKADKTYTKKWMAICQQMYDWLKDLL